MCRRVKSFAQSHEAGKFGIQTWVYPGSKKRISLQCRRCTGDAVWFLGREDLLKEGMATHSSILAWTILWTEQVAKSQTRRKQLNTHIHLVHTAWFPGQCAELNIRLPSQGEPGSLHPKGILWFWTYFPTISRQTPTLWSLISQSVLTHNVVS